MEFFSFFMFALLFAAVVTFFKVVKIVPQQEAWIVERLGRFDRKLEAGLTLLMPYIERVAYKHSLKETALEVHEQTAITRDNVTVVLDGIIYLRIIDPVHASYGVANPIFAITQLAQTTMRSEIGKLSMDQTFEERERLNANIVTALNNAAQAWGIQCMRYEIRNISPPATVLKAMELQMVAERQKRASILQSEGERQSQINIAEATKQQVVLGSEGALTDQVNRAKGEAEAILQVAQATAEGITLLAASIQKAGGQDAVALRIAEQYVSAFGNLAKTSTTILLPANAADAGSMVAQALGVFDTIKNKSTSSASGPWGNKA